MRGALRFAGVPAAAIVASSLVWQPAAQAASMVASVSKGAQSGGGDPRLERYFTQKVTWSKSLCPRSQASQTSMECAQLLAPKDWNDPSKGELRVGISRAAGKDATPRRGRLLLANPGGPGGDGLAYALQIGKGYGLTGTHTAIGIDPRGLGLSTPVKCDFGPMGDFGGMVKDSRTLTREAAIKLMGQNAALLKKCQDQHGDVLRYVNSAQTAGDFVMVSRALGYQTFDYYGTSYGTWLGSVIEKLHPQDVDRIVLDSNMDWAGGSMEKGFAYQPEAFQAEFDKSLLPWYARHNDVYHLGKDAATVNATYERVRGALGRGVIPGVTPDNLDTVMVLSLYNTQMWDPVGRVMHILDLATAGSRTAKTKAAAIIPALKASLGAGVSPEVFTAVACGDTAWEQDPAKWYDRASEHSRKYPLIGARDVVSKCAGWTFGPALTQEQLNRPVNGVLMVQNESDGPTSYKGALATRRQAKGQVRMVMVDDAPGHGVTSPCAVGTAAAYLTRGTYPSRDVHCQSPLLRSGRVTDSAAYEFGNRASNADPLPAPLDYQQRDLRDPAVDPGGPGRSASQGQASLATLSH